MKASTRRSSSGVAACSAFASFAACARGPRWAPAADLLRFVREQSVKIDHPHVLAPYGWAAEDEHVVIAMDLSDGGTLENAIQDHGAFSDKVAEEISRVTGHRDRVTLADRDDLPFTEATLNEVWRFCNVVPIPPPRKLSTPIKLGDYEIPGQTIFMTSSYSVHMDSQYWKDPESFRPDRFLHEGRFTPDERNIPFGIGKRRCLGETLARMENFLFFANLMKHFSFRCVEGADPPDTRPMAGFTNGPAPFCMKVVKNSQ